MKIPVHHRGRVVALALVDDVDAGLASLRWFLSHGYARARRDGKPIEMQHAVLAPKAGFDVSHENGDKLDNRRANLCHRTRSRNMANPRDGAHVDSASGVRGVYRENRNLAKPWRGRVQVDGKPHATRRCATPEEAAAELATLRAGLGL